MDEEKIRLDIDEALGKVNAHTCLLAAVVGTLVTKGLLTKGDAASLTGIASETLSGMEGVTDYARALGESALRGFAEAWTEHITKN
jgi:hypothetical protein